MAKILIVEDEPGIAFSLESDLQAEGYEVAIVADGVEAVRRARREAFDLILLDVMLPHKDGFQVCRELRARIRVALRHQASRKPEGGDLEGQLRVASEVQQRLFPQSRPPLATSDYVGFCQAAP